MKSVTLVLASLLVASFFFLGPATAQEQVPTALQIVNRRMDFYNQHNFDEFIKLYADDVKIDTYPDKLLGIGKEEKKPAKVINWDTIFSQKAETFDWDKVFK